MKRTIWVSVALAALLSLFVAPAAMAQPQQEGLVNVNVSDVLVQLPVAVAANVCEVNANVLAEQLRQGGATCDAVAEPDSTVAWNDGNRNGNGQQNGLVNVNVSDIIVQVPIGIAANVCELNVNVLAQQERRGQAVCDAVATPIADA